MKCSIFSFLFLCTVFFCFFNCSNSSKRKNNGIIPVVINKAKDKTLNANTRLHYIDSFLKTKNLKKDSLFFSAIILKRKLYKLLKNDDSTLYYEKYLLKHTHAVSDHFHTGMATWYLATRYYRNNNYDSAFYYYNQSKTSFKTIKDSSRTGKQLLSMATIQQIEDDYIGSKETAAEAIPYLQNKEDTKHLASLYNVLAINHQAMLNYGDAKAYYLKAIETSPLNAYKNSFQNNLATMYIQNKDYRKAIDLFKTLVDDVLMKKDPNQYARIIDNLGYAEWLENKTTTPELLLNALRIRSNNKDSNGLIASYLHLGEFYLDSDLEKSNHYLNKAITISKAIKSPKGELEALQFLMQLKPKAIAYKDRYIQLKDSLYKQELKAKTQFAKMKYDDELNQQTILKLEAEKAKQALEVSKQQTQKIVYLSSGILLLIVGGFVVYLLKQQHQREKLKEVYATETRISQKVHDELANDMYQLLHKVQHENNLPKTNIVSELDDIYKRTRDISHETSSINFDDAYFFLELKDMLHAYQTENVTIYTIGLTKAIWENVNDLKKIAVLRTLQELMTNMEKHSKATQVVVKFKRASNKIHITYVDNGVGFDKNNVLKSNGLQNAENRIKGIKGNLTFEVERKKGVGISIIFHV